MGLNKRRDEKCHTFFPYYIPNYVQFSVNSKALISRRTRAPILWTEILLKITNCNHYLHNGHSTQSFVTNSTVEISKMLEDYIIRRNRNAERGNGLGQIFQQSLQIVVMFLYLYLVDNLLRVCLEQNVTSTLECCRSSACGQNTIIYKLFTIE